MKSGKSRKEGKQEIKINIYSVIQNSRKGFTVTNIEKAKKRMKTLVKQIALTDAVPLRHQTYISFFIKFFILSIALQQL